MNPTTPASTRLVITWGDSCQLQRPATCPARGPLHRPCECKNKEGFTPGKGTQGCPSMKISLFSQPDLHCCSLGTTIPPAIAQCSLPGATKHRHKPQRTSGGQDHCQAPGRSMPQGHPASPLGEKQVHAGKALRHYMYSIIVGTEKVTFGVSQCSWPMGEKRGS